MRKKKINQIFQLLLHQVKNLIFLISIKMKKMNLYLKLLITILKFKKQSILSYQKNQECANRLSSKTTIKVIIIILLLLFAIPLFDLDTYYDVLSGPEYQSVLIQNMYQNSSSYQKAADFMFSYYGSTDYPVMTAMFWDSNSNVYYSHTSSINSNNYRDLEVKEYQGDLYLITVCYRVEAQLDSILKIFKTAFVIFLLVVGGMLISFDADKYVLRPLEILLSKVNDVAADPFRALKLNLMKKQLDQYESDSIEESKTTCCKKSNQQIYETEMLDNAIIKICSLLVLGFGESGCSIISLLLKLDHINQSKVADLNFSKIKGK